MCIHIQTEQRPLPKDIALRMPRPPDRAVRVRQGVRRTPVEQAVLGHTVRSEGVLREWKKSTPDAQQY